MHILFRIAMVDHFVDIDIIILYNLSFEFPEWPPNDLVHIGCKTHGLHSLQAVKRGQAGLRYNGLVLDAPARTMLGRLECVCV